MYLQILTTDAKNINEKSKNQLCFETDWNSRDESVKQYLFLQSAQIFAILDVMNLFSNLSNNLSFVSVIAGVSFLS